MATCYFLSANQRATDKDVLVRRHLYITRASVTSRFPPPNACIRLFFVVFLSLNRPIANTSSPTQTSWYINEEVQVMQSDTCHAGTASRRPTSH